MITNREQLGGNTAGIEEIDPIRSMWRVRFGRETGEDGAQTSTIDRQIANLYIL